MNCALSLILATLSGCAAQFHLRDYGTCATAITTISDCNAAAAAMSMPDTSASDDAQTGVSWDPPYCYFESNELKFNAGGSNTGICTASDQCLCAGEQSPATPPPPLPPLAPANSIFTILEGHEYCQFAVHGEYTNGYDCVTDGTNQQYGNNERCTIRVNYNAVLVAPEYDVERNYDFITISGTQIGRAHV